MTSQMAKEIAEQPAALQLTIDALRPLHGEVRDLARSTDRVLLFGRGSSDTAATYGRYLLEAVSGISAAMGAPSIATLYRSSLDLSSTLVVICSQSGHTAELLEVNDWAKGCGAKVIAVTNESNSPLAEVVDLALVTHAGAELAVPATKSHTTCLLTLAELATSLTAATSRRYHEMVVAIDQTPDAVKTMLGHAEQAQALAIRYGTSTAWCVSGRGFTYPTALELALKIEETTSVPCIGLSQADFQHGPVAVFGPHRPLIVAAASSGPSLPGLRALVAEARARDAEVVVLGGDDDLRAAATSSIAGPNLGEAVAPIALIVSGQLLAEALSRSTGRNPDRPAGLSKVTQTT
ncbi:MAG TPA: SIS domain-containing protein [Actinomycetes bacterium]|nr:SIS domain-containing protein [Actinomycetes bacterium]